VVISVGRAAELLAAFTEALRGVARDVRCGALTLASLAGFVASHASAIRLPEDDRLAVPWFVPPSLERMWDLGWSTRTRRWYRPERSERRGAPDRRDPARVVSGSTL
jgi:hypothetical protein